MLFEFDQMNSIENLLNKPYTVQGDQTKKYVCWSLCKKVYGLLGLNLDTQQELRQRIDIPIVPCIVMFRAVMSWHSGVVWPDGLHFIHACPVDIMLKDPTEYIVKKDKLTAWPYVYIIEGYYRTEVVQKVTVMRAK